MKYWTARDLDGNLYLYTHEPIRRNDAFRVSRGLMYHIDGHLVSEITWENSPQQIELRLVNNHEPVDSKR